MNKATITAIIILAIAMVGLQTTNASIGQNWGINAADTTAPNLTITYPASGQYVTGTVVMTANASDPESGIKNVKFYIDNVLLCTDTTSPYSCSWNTASYTEGLHLVKVTARNGANKNTTKLADATVDRTDPTATVTNPSNSSVVAGTVSFDANATDNFGISKVEFYVDNVLKSTDITSPYSYSWNTTTETEGSHSLRTVSYDLVTPAANDTNSSTITVTVNNVDTTPPTITSFSVGNGAYVSGTVNLTVWATDNSGILDKAEFYIDNSLVFTDNNNHVNNQPYSYFWNTLDGNTFDGNHSIITKVFDLAGNSATINITAIVDNTAPSIAITSPLNDENVSGVVSILTSVSDNFGISKVEFLIDNLLKFTDFSAPYSFNWNTADGNSSNGSHTITAKAYDLPSNPNNSSHTINVTVNN